MSSRNTAPTGRIHPRTRDLAAIIGQLNVWAMAPQTPDRVKGLKKALNDYSRAIKGKKYPAMTHQFCMRTAYCNEAPTRTAETFQDFFGKPGADACSPPWEA